MKEEHITAYPLTWPDGWKRHGVKKSSQFKTKKSEGYGHNKISLQKAMFFVLDELQRMGISNWNVIISTCLKLRQDGLPKSGQRKPDDIGVSVWWKDDGVQRVLALDKYDRLEDNLYAIGKTIEAFRGIDRWGGGEILERTFSGFTPLPSPDHVVARSWRDVLDYYGDDVQEANKAYRIARGKAHPDNGGTNEKYHEVNRAWAECEKEL